MFFSVQDNKRNVFHQWKRRYRPTISIYIISSFSYPCFHKNKQKKSENTQQHPIPTLKFLKTKTNIYKETGDTKGRIRISRWPKRSLKSFENDPPMTWDPRVIAINGMNGTERGWDVEDCKGRRVVLATVCLLKRPSFDCAKVIFFARDEFASHRSGLVQLARFTSTTNWRCLG